MNMAKKLREQLGVGKSQDKVLNVQYAHNGEQIVVMFGVDVNNLTMTVEQCNDMIKALQGSRDALMKHRAGK